MSTLTRIGLFFLLALPGLPSLAVGAPQAEAASTYRVAVTAMRAQPGEIRELTRVQGEIEAPDAPQIMSKVAAEVIEVLADEGDRVTAGQVLARLDDESFRLDRDAAQADIARLHALLENQRSTLERDQSLFKQKLVSDAKLDESRSAVKQTQAQLVHARSLLDKSLYQLSHTKVIAPIGGVVQKRSISPGDYVNPSSPNSKPLFQIVDTGQLRARLYFPENLAHRVSIGLPVELTKNGASVQASIGHIRPMLEPGNRALHALADFVNQPQWRPGESITGIALMALHQQAVLVPEAVLVRRPAGLVVYRLEAGRAREQSVTTGIRQGDRVEILSGVKAGELLALDGAGYLSDGAAVEIKEEKP